MKQEKSQYLLTLIGEIDDRYLAEAMAYHPEARKRSWMKALAACLALLFGLGVMLPAILRFSQTIYDHGGEKPGNWSSNEHYESLDALLSDLKNGSYRQISSFSSLSYTSGKASLVWQYRDGKIYTAPLTDQDLNRLRSALGKGKNVGVQTPALECKVWILDGQGNVATPYLRASEGNLGRIVFDYEAEIYPSDEVINCISEIVNRTEQ